MRKRERERESEIERERWRQIVRQLNKVGMIFTSDTDGGGERIREMETEHGQKISRTDKVIINFSV